MFAALVALVALVALAVAQDLDVELRRTLLLKLSLRQLPPFAQYLQEYESALRFLVENMPENDLLGGEAGGSKITPRFLAELTMNRVNTYHARKWSENIPRDIFNEFVLPYAVLSEPRDASMSWLLDLKAYLEGLLDTRASTKRMDLNSTALWLNYAAFNYTSPRIEFQAARPNRVNAYSPRQVVKAKRASCTGESVYLVHCLRLVGIPARVAGVPHWNLPISECPFGLKSPACGNHNWVEVYVGGKQEWAFLDQNMNAHAVNQAWFFPKLTRGQLSRSALHGIYASTWNRSTRNALYFPLVFDPHYKQVSAVDRTAWYHEQEQKEPTKVLVEQRII